MLGREVGRIVVGAMPLSRSHLLPRTIARFHARRPTLPVKALDGPYDDLMAAPRRGGFPRRRPARSGADRRCRAGTAVRRRAGDGGATRPPALRRGRPATADLARFPFVVSTEGTPTRRAFDRLFKRAGCRPQSLIETGSMILMRELLRISDHIGCISRLQVEAELALGAMTVLPFAMDETVRPIGLTLRSGWVPTAAQQDFLDALRSVARR